MIFKALLLASAIAVSGFVSCKSRQVGSKGKIDNGTFALDSGSYMPGILPFVLKTGEIQCTATAVSDNTILTAAHCVTFPKNVVAESNPKLGIRAVDPVCVRGLDDKVMCSTKAFIPGAYAPDPLDSRKDNWAADIAVAIFPAGTFKYFHVVSKTSPAEGLEVLMVGFSSEMMHHEELPKRWGRNTVLARSSSHPSSEIHTAITGAAVVGISPGDSGGPIFDRECRIMGVASRMDYYGQYKSSIHVGVHTPENMKFLEDVRVAAGARYCGLEHSCDGFGGVIRPVTVASATRFPCKSSIEDQDPVIKSAIERSHGLRTQARDRLASSPINCLDSQEVFQRGGAGGLCLGYQLWESSNQSQACDAAFVSISGEKMLSVEDATTDQGSEFVRAGMSDPDMAIGVLTTRLESNGEQILKSLSCPTKAASSSCCLKPVCRKVIPATAGDPPSIGDSVVCPESMVTSAIGANWLRNNIYFMNPRLVPGIEDLEKSPFPCLNTQAMALRKTKGICYEAESDIPAAANGGGANADVAKCFEVKSAQKTSRQIGCPASFLDRVNARPTRN